MNDTANREDRRDIDRQKLDRQNVDRRNVDRRNVEPAVDADSGKRLAEERPDAPHPPSRFDAGTGQGTVLGPPSGEFQDRPILDGSTMSAEAEASVPNPYRGQSDPATIHAQPAVTTTNTNRWLFSGLIAFLVVGLFLVMLMQWDPVWSGIGIVVGLVALLGMLAVRASKLRRPARLWVDAVLLAIIWLVPLAVIVSIMIGRREEIW